MTKKQTDFVKRYLTENHRIAQPIQRHQVTRVLFYGCGDRDYVPSVIEYLTPLFPYGVDLEFVPGGPRRTYREIMDPEKIEISVAELAFYIQHHGVTGLILAAHKRCGRYNHSRRNEQRRLTPDQLDERAKKHILVLKKALVHRLPDSVTVFPIFIDVVTKGGKEYAEFVPL